MGNRLRFFLCILHQSPCGCCGHLSTGSGSVGAGSQPVKVGGAGRSSAVFMASPHERPREASARSAEVPRGNLHVYFESFAGGQAARGELEMGTQPGVMRSAA